MFSGKTTELIRIYNRYTNCEIPCCVVNHSCDKKRWNDTTDMANHNGIRILYLCGKIKRHSRIGRIL